MNSNELVKATRDILSDMDEANSKFIAPNAILNFYKNNQHIMVTIDGNESTSAGWRVVTEGFNNQISHAGKGLISLTEWLEKVTK